MRWLPLVTFLQTGMDAMNAMLKVPGEFTSFGHDYRADMAGFVGDAYRLPNATAAQLAGIEQILRPWSWSGPSASRPSTVPLPAARARLRRRPGPRRRALQPTDPWGPLDREARAEPAGEHPGRRPVRGEEQRLSINLIRSAEGWWVQRGSAAFPVDAELPSTAEL